MYSINYIWSWFFLVRACAVNWSTPIGLNAFMFVQIVFADHNNKFILNVTFPLTLDVFFIRRWDWPLMGLFYRSSDIFGIDINCYWNRKILISTIDFLVPGYSKLKLSLHTMWTEKHASSVTKLEYACLTMVLWSLRQCYVLHRWW